MFIGQNSAWSEGIQITSVTFAGENNGVMEIPSYLYYSPSQFVVQV